MTPLAASVLSALRSMLRPGKGAPATLLAVLLALFLAIAPLAALGGCQGAPASGPATPAVPRPTPQPMALTVLHTNDTWGYLLPCG